MKHTINILRLGLPALMLLAATVIRTPGLMAQERPVIQAMFADPAWDPVSRTYSVDILLGSAGATRTFFGMNLRFYYDATKLRFIGIDQYAQGHGPQRDAPKAYVGNERSGVELLGLTRAAGFVNGAVYALDDLYPLILEPKAWKKLCRARFAVMPGHEDETAFCPSLVWDLEPFKGQGSLVPGSDGLLITVKDEDRSSRAESVMTDVEGIPFNWRYRRQAGLPFGDPVSQECITVAETTSMDPGLTEAEGYVLFQNHPNPFDEQTTIEFILPHAQDAKLHLFSLQGELLETIPGSYPAGRNKVVLLRKPWMDRVGMVYYQLAAEDNVTLVRKMNMVTR